MSDDAMILFGNEPDDGDENMDRMEGDEEDGYTDDGAQVLDDPEDGDFRLDGGDDVDFAEEDDNDANGYNPDSDDEVAHKKRKRNVPEFLTRWRNRSTIVRKAADADAMILKEDNEFQFKATTRVLGEFGRRNRRKGDSLPAYHRRVSHELDSDDEMMLEMRQKGFSDRQIADKLANSGRARYDQKSISTRIMRIRLAQAKHVDTLLRDGFKEWEFEDDCLLMQAHALADIEISYEMERLRAWRFRKVSDYMRRLNNDALFSATACRDRYNALLNGTAIIPTDLDDNPDARRAANEISRQSRQAARSAAQAEEDEQEAKKRKSKDALRARNAQKAEDVASRRASQEAAKAQRAMARATQAQLRAQRAGQAQAAKAQRNAQIKQQNKKRAVSKGKGKAKTTSATLALVGARTVDDARPDPRGCLSLDDLVAMCEDRGIEADDLDEADLVRALQDADNEYSMDELKTMCHAKGLNADASKPQMKYQLALAAAKECSSFRVSVNNEEEQNDE